MIKPRFYSRIFFFVVLVELLLLFIVLEPKVSAKLFIGKRTMLYNDFMHELTTEQQMNAQDFWRFQEFYSPGSFTFNRKGFAITTLEETLNNKQINFSLPKNSLSFLVFQSPLVYSIDTLVYQPNNETIIADFVKENKGDILTKKNDFVAIKTGENVALLFILPKNQMEKANGFLDYKEDDKKITFDASWLHISSILSP